jgi:hypothetical protein
MPPTVNKQRATTGPAPTRGTTTKGSILSRAVDVGSLQAGPIKFAVYGQNRVGKTTLACTFPKPLLIVSVEPDRTGGADSVKGVKGVSLVQPATTHEYVQLVQELAAGGHGYETVVLDSATSLQDMIGRDILGVDDLPTVIKFGQYDRSFYMSRSEKTRDALRPLLNLDCNVVVTAKEKDHNPPKDERPKLIKGLQVESFFSFELGSATAGWLADSCGCIGRLYLARETKTKTVTVNGKTVEREEETGRSVRRLLTQLHVNFAAGFRAADPSKVPEHIDNPTYDAIRAVMTGE